MDAATRAWLDHIAASSPINNTHAAAHAAPISISPQPPDTNTNPPQLDIHGLPEKQRQRQRRREGFGGERGRGRGVRAAEHGAVWVRGRADVGGLRRGPRRRRTQRALLPLRHAPWQAGEKRPLRRTGRRAPWEGGPLHRGLPVGGAVQARRRRPRRRRVYEREEPRRWLPLLAEKCQSSPSSLSAVTRPATAN